MPEARRILTENEAASIRGVLASERAGVAIFRPKAGDDISTIPEDLLEAARIMRGRLEDGYAAALRGPKKGHAGRRNGKSTLGIPKKVAKEYVAADKGGKLPARKRKVK